MLSNGFVIVCCGLRVGGIFVFFIEVVDDWINDVAIGVGFLVAVDPLVSTIFPCLI